MRYLYGDSVPFPLQYDFLAALDVFCVQAARVVRLDAEARAVRKATEDAAVARAHALDELETFHTAAVVALREGAQGSAEPLVDDYVRQLADLAARMVDGARRAATEATERDQRAAASEGSGRHTEVRDALEKLLIAVRLPVVESRVSMSLTGTASALAGVFTYRDGLVASFDLGELDEWRQPRQVREFAENVTLPVGVKRSLFKRTLAPETISLDEYVVGGFDLQDDRAELRLRKKAEHPDSLVFTVTRVEDRVRAEVHHPDDAEADEGLAPVLDDASATEVERLWQLLRKACAPALVHKKRLVKLDLGGGDVFATDQPAAVIALIVDTIAAVVTEIARRSPNTQELSLKVENDAGRREEIYLRKDQLQTALLTVPAAARRLFDPLGLLPTITAPSQAPPPPAAPPQAGT